MSYSTRVAKLWPHLSIGEDTCGREMTEAFYVLTYSYADDDWGDRLAESADNDELQRVMYAFKLCLEFSMDGKEGRPRLSEFWIGLHQMVVCPLFKKALSGELNERYISWPTKTYKLPKSKVQEIYDSVYVSSVSPTAEEDWACQYFYMWVMQDHIHHAASLTIPSKPAPVEAAAAAAKPAPDEETVASTKAAPVKTASTKAAAPKAAPKKKEADVEDVAAAPAKAKPAPKKKEVEVTAAQAKTSSKKKAAEEMAAAPAKAKPAPKKEAAAKAAKDSGDESESENEDSEKTREKQRTQAYLKRKQDEYVHAVRAEMKENDDEVEETPKPKPKPKFKVFKVKKASAAE